MQNRPVQLPTSITIVDARFNRSSSSAAFRRVDVVAKPTLAARCPPPSPMQSRPPMFARAAFLARALTSFETLRGILTSTCFIVIQTAGMNCSSTSLDQSRRFKGGRRKTLKLSLLQIDIKQLFSIGQFKCRAYKSRNCHGSRNSHGPH